MAQINYKTTAANVSTANNSTVEVELGKKAASSHTHTKSQITDFPSSLKNPSSLKVQFNGGTTDGTNQFTYDGSAAKTVNITPGGIGAAASSHTHTKSQITDFPSSLRNPNSLAVKLNGGTTEGTNLFTYNGSAAKTVNITASGIGAAASSHTHTTSQITDFPASLKNPSSLTIQTNGTSQGSYDGSAAKTINITAANVGAAAASHTHTKANITDFPSALKNPSALTVQTNGTSQGTYDGSEAKTINITLAALGLSSGSTLPSSGTAGQIFILVG